MSVFRFLLPLALLGAACLHGAVIPEPDTVFYGMVINRQDGHEQLLTSGQLSWTIGSGSSTQTIIADLEPLPGGLSYRIKVPHEALSSGLTVSAAALPLGVVATTHQVLSMQVDGITAEVLSPGRTSFTVEQLERAATHRLDLRIGRPFVDSDGDGMPDWWEDQFGLNKLSNDAAGDRDSDGRNNLAEYRAGTNPAHASDEPEFITPNLVAYADGVNALALLTSDSNTPPSQLVYTLKTAPAGLLLRRGISGITALPDKPLLAGATFTQADVNAGRILLPHADGGPLNAVKIDLEVTDGSTRTEGTASVRFYRPELAETRSVLASLAASGSTLPGVAATEQQRAKIYLLASEKQFLAWDLSGWMTATVAAAANTGGSLAMIGTPGNDQMAGGNGADWLAGGAGNDALTGGAGGDRFLFNSSAEGNDSITDFDAAAGDVIDLSAALNGTAKDLRQYVRLTGSTLALDSNGDGSGFTDATIALGGAAPASVFSLFHAGTLVAAGKTLPPFIVLASKQTEARENGPTPALFTLTRLGPLDAPLEVTISIAGSAINGQDYEPLTTSVIIPAGEATQEIAITPYQDSITEPRETVQITLQARADYVIGGTASATAYINDLQPEIQLEALEPLAIVEEGAPGIFAVHRSGVIDRTTLVRLAVTGNATPGVDYTRLPAYVNFAAYQTSALLSVTPLSTASLAQDAESVILTLTTDPSYLSGAASTAKVMIVKRRTSAAEWLGENSPAAETSQARAKSTSPSSTASFASSSEAFTSPLPDLIRYAFVQDPKDPKTLANLPHLKMVNGYPAIEFTKAWAATDLRYVIEVSDDLKTWRSGSGNTEELPAWNSASDPRAVLWRSVTPVTQRRHQFMRVRVETLP